MILEADEPLEKLLPIIINSGHSRFPVMNNNINQNINDSFAMPGDLTGSDGVVNYQFSTVNLLGSYQSGQMGLTVTQLSFDFGGSNPSLPTKR